MTSINLSWKTSRDIPNKRIEFIKNTGYGFLRLQIRQWDGEILKHSLAYGGDGTLNTACHDVVIETSIQDMIEEPWIKPRFVWHQSICPLVKGIFTNNIVKNLADTGTITCGDD